MKKTKLFQKFQMIYYSTLFQYVYGSWIMLHGSCFMAHGQGPDASLPTLCALAPLLAMSQQP